MKILCIFLTLVLAITATTTQHYNTNNRQVYASWTVCDGCYCNSFDLYANEHSTQNSADTTPPTYIYYSHTSYDSCLFVYESEWLESSNPIPGLEISASGRTAELVTDNLTDSTGHTISISLSWSSADSQNNNNCNCQNIYSNGIDSFRINSKSTYRVSQLVGTIAINNIVYTAPTDAFGYIAGSGQKTIVTQHH
jgi:hypothetical protein